MKVFLACLSHSSPLYYRDGKYPKQPFRELVSFYTCVDKFRGQLMVPPLPARQELFLDSGAFSAWSKGVAIDLDAYADFVLAHPGQFSVVANLDVIPGSWGHVPSQREIDASAERGWENYRYLEKKLRPASLRPMHIYHQGEDIKWLKKLIDEAEYLGVSPGNDRVTEEKIAWLDGLMPYLTDERGCPSRKFHGFGVTQETILFRYPWFSVDSAAWLLTSRFGACYIPLGHRVERVIFSSKSPRMRDLNGKHFRTFTQPEQRVIEQYLAKHGYAPGDLADHYQKRDEVNCLFFLALEQQYQFRPFRRGDVQPTFAF